LDEGIQNLIKIVIILLTKIDSSIKEDIAKDWIIK
jgi:hypothetical protein